MIRGKEYWRSRGWSEVKDGMGLNRVLELLVQKDPSIYYIKKCYVVLMLHI